MLRFAAVLIAAALTQVSSRPPDIAFAPRMIDPGSSETAAVIDLNRDGQLDIVSGEHWYQGPTWTKQRFRALNYTSGYVDAFSDHALDVDKDGFPDIVTVTWFAKKIAWWKNPGRERGRWTETVIDSGFPVEFSQMADVDGDGQARELLPQSGDAAAPLAWYSIAGGKWQKHVVSDKSYGHGIGLGDVNGDGRADILTPQGWFEAPVDRRAGKWLQHADWSEKAHLGFLHVLDVNRDGKPDIVSSNGHDYGVFWIERGEGVTWKRHLIDEAWSQAHATTMIDLNGDGSLDLVTGKRFMAHNGKDPGEKEPLGVYWYEHRKTHEGGIEWIRHLVDYGGRLGGGMQIPVVDIDGDGDLDLVCAGKSGLFLVENLTNRRS